MADNPLFIDNSTLKSMAKCSTQALVRYGLDYASREERAPLKSGAAGHLALETYYRGKTAVQFDGQTYQYDREGDYLHSSTLVHYRRAIQFQIFFSFACLLKQFWVLCRHPASFWRIQRCTTEFAS